MLADGKGSLNWQTFGILLRTKYTESICDFIQKNLIIKGEYDLEFNKAHKFPLKGIILERYMTSVDKLITSEMLQKTV